MTIVEAAVLFGAACAGGAINSVAGGGTFLTFPILLLTGASPIAANATNTMALWPGSVASNIAYRREIALHRTMLPRLLVINLLGGLAGAFILLKTPETTFTSLIPYLLLIATLIFAFGRHVTTWLHRHRQKTASETPHSTWPRIMPQFLIALYGGYFGAGIGILLLALLEWMGMRQIHEMNALKTLLATAINGIAVVTFILAGVILWPQALVMLAGAVFGGYGGASLARTLPPARVRQAVIVIASLMTVYFFIR